MLRSRRGGGQPDWAIKPEQYVDQDSIITTWDNVLRLVAIIKLKESTASDIFRRLNSYSRQHSLIPRSRRLSGSEPRRVCRRLFGLSHAAMTCSLAWA
jgi:hypothetical protein